jgi:hypothetical protein
MSSFAGGMSEVASDRSNWGLIIQGPLVSLGDERFRNQNFNCMETIHANLDNSQGGFGHRVISGWHNQDFGIEASNVTVIKAHPPTFDRKNSRKQFLSTMRGVDYLLSLGVENVLKIRTDQEWPATFFDDITSRTDNKAECERGQIVMSDFVFSSPFYAGDFIFAGNTQTIKNWLTSVLSFGSVNLHYATGVDYILKYLCANDPEYPAFINPYLPLSIQIADPRNFGLFDYWDRMRRNHFDFTTRESFSRMRWRGEEMSSLVNVDAFGFREDNTASYSTSKLFAEEVGPWTAGKKILDEVRRHYRANNLGRSTTLLQEFVRGLSTGRWND